MRGRRPFLAVALIFGLVLGIAPGAMAAGSIDGPYDYASFGPEGASVVALQGDVLAVGYSSSYQYGSGADGIAFYDVSDPTAPTLIRKYNVQNQVEDLDWAGPLLFEARDGVGLVVWNASAPISASMIGTLAIGADAVDVSGDEAYVGEWNGTLHSVDVSVPTNPTLLDSLATASSLTDVEIAAPFLHVGARNSGGAYTTVNITDPHNLSIYDTEPGGVYDLTVTAGYAFTAESINDAPNGLGAWDVTSINDISLEATVPWAGSAWSIDSIGGLAVLGSSSGEIVFYDITTGSDPQLLRHVPTGTRAWDIVSTASYTYVAAGSEGLIVVENPTTTGLDAADAIAGSNRYDTAIQASRAAFPWGSQSVVIATGLAFPDALGGSALAGLTWGPILLTDPDGLSAATIAEINRLDAGEAIILGGEGAVGPAVETKLDDIFGASNVQRIGGSNRYETAELIAEQVFSREGSATVGFVATGLNYPDAIAAAPLAAAGPYPIFLTDPASISGSTLDAMVDAGVTQAIVLGGEGAVSAAVETALDTRFGAANVSRLSGSNRYATAARIAQWGIDNLYLAWDNVAFATGESFPDALTGGVLQAREKSVLLLSATGSLSPEPAAKITSNIGEIGRVKYLGGTGALSQDVRDAVEALLP